MGHNPNSTPKEPHAQTAGAVLRRRRPAAGRRPSKDDFNRRISASVQKTKDLLGSAPYQVMSATALVRFWTLVSCTPYFLDERRAGLERPGEHLAGGDVRRAIQSEHQRNFLAWVEDQFRSGVTTGQLGARLAAQKCKDSGHLKFLITPSG